MQRATWCAILAISTAALAGCGEQPTEPVPPDVAASAVAPAAVGSDRWITRADMPRAQSHLAVAVLPNASGKSVVYAIAGWKTHVVQAYDVSTNSWSFKANYPDAAEETNGAGVINGKIYVSGGSTGANGRYNSLYQYNPATNVWTRKHDMPAAAYGGVTGVLGGRLYVLTSCGEDWACYPVIYKAFWRYDPATDRWSALPTPQSVHSWGSAGVIGGKFYVVGGANGPEANPGDPRLLEVFDPVTNRWTTLPGLTGLRTSAAGAVLGGKLYVIGGFGIDTTSDHPFVPLITVKVYDPVTRRWTAAHRLPAAAAGGYRAAGQVVVNGQSRIELVGGARPDNLQYIP